MVRVTWNEFKQLLDRGLPFQYITESSGDVLYSQDGSLTFQSFAYPDNTEYHNNYKPLAKTRFTPLDAEGAVTQRPKVAKTGSALLLLPVEVETSTYGGIFSKTQSNEDRGFISHKLYDSEGAEITSSENELTATKLVIDVEPTSDIELIGGSIHQGNKATSDLRIYVTIVPDIPVNYGGSVEMVGGINLKLVESIRADGRAAKLLKYSAQNHTNKIRFVFNHEAGLRHKLMIILEYFR